MTGWLLAKACSQPGMVEIGTNAEDRNTSGKIQISPKACTDSAYTGLAIGDEESVQAFGLIWLFPLTFLSSAFVPISTMPGWLQAFANNQPVTYVVDTMRALALGGPVEASLWKSLVWLVGIFVVFLPLAVRAYRRAS